MSGFLCFVVAKGGLLLDTHTLRVREKGALASLVIARWGLVGEDT